MGLLVVVIISCYIISCYIVLFIALSLLFLSFLKKMASLCDMEIDSFRRVLRDTPRYVIISFLENIVCLATRYSIAYKIDVFLGLPDNHGYVEFVDREHAHECCECQECDKVFMRENAEGFNKSD